MYAHLGAHHPTDYSKVAPKGGTGLQRKRPSAGVAPGQRLLTSLAPYDKHSERHKTLTTAVTEFITTGMLPIHVVEKPAFKNLVRALDSRYELPGRNYFTRTAIPTRYAEVKESIRKMLKNVCFVSCTMDGWSSAVRDPYLSLTVHFIDADWSLKTKCLHTMYCPESHTADNIAQFVREGLKEYGLELRCITTMTTDAAANMVSACNKLEVLRISCVGHILHNAITNALNHNEDVSRILVSARKIVSAFSYSFHYRQRLSKAQKELDIPQQGLVNDVATRWSSKYKMLSRIHTNLPAISQLFADGNYLNISNLY